MPKNNLMKDPAFLFYTQDFLAGTQFMTDEQVGKYIRLLVAQHQVGHLTEKQVLMICKTHDEDILNKFKKDGAGNYFNERLEYEILKRKNFSESRKNNRMGKSKKNQLSKKHINNISFSHDKDMENENENENINVIIGEDINKKKYIEFDSFWELYNKKTDRAKCEMVFYKLTEAEKKMIFEKLPDYVRSTPDIQYRKNPLTWLRGKCWKDNFLNSNTNEERNKFSNKTTTAATHNTDQLRRIVKGDL